MCLAIPGQIKELEPGASLAVVEVSGVRRKVNVDLLVDEGLTIGDWVLIHVGFAMSKVSEQQATEQMRMLAMMGGDEEAMEEIRGYDFGNSDVEAS